MDQLSPSWIKKQDLVASLTKAMDDSSIAVRRAAAAQLCQLKTETAVDALWAHRDDAENRQNILSHLASLHDQRVLPLLTEQLNDERASIRASAIWPLVNFGAAAIDPLIDRLNDSASEVRLAAIRGLVELHAKAALPTLEKLLADASPDADPEIRAYAARAIKRIDRD